MLLIPTLLCPKSWETMSGDETRRFCSYCNKHVHNLAALSAQERLSLLSSPAASICSRYQLAIRRPAKGKKQSYLMHLAKYGVGVALTGSVLLVLWEMEEQAEKQKFYRTATDRRLQQHREMPAELYEEHRVYMLGAIALPPQSPARIEPGKIESNPPDHVYLKLDPIEINRLIEATKPSAPKSGG
jgi:hypothetical protein